MARKGESITLSLTPEEMAQLELLAIEHGCKWGDRPNVSELIRRIANGEISVGKLPPKRVAIVRAIKAIEQCLSELRSCL